MFFLVGLSGSSITLMAATESRLSCLSRRTSAESMRRTSIHFGGFPYRGSSLTRRPAPNLVKTAQAYYQRRKRSVLNRPHQAFWRRVRPQSSNTIAKESRFHLGGRTSIMSTCNICHADDVVAQRFSRGTDAQERLLIHHQCAQGHAWHLAIATANNPLGHWDILSCDCQGQHRSEQGGSGIEMAGF